MKKLLLIAFIAQPISGLAQESQDAGSRDLSYTYAELRYLDTDNGGDGLRLLGSYALDQNWLIVGGLTSLDYGRSVDVTTIEVGAGYVYDFREDFDLVGTLQFVDTDVDAPGGGRSDNGFSLAAGARGMVSDQLEVRGFVHHVNLDNNDTFLEIAADYYFSSRFSAGVSLEIAGDDDAFSIGMRLFFP
jgi:hypothetical protein